MANENEELRQRVAELEHRNRQLEKALRESEDRFFTIFHASSNPMAITTLKDGRVVDINEADASLGGFTREELIGHTVEELCLVNNPDQRGILKQRVMKEGKVRNLQLDLRTKEGEARTVLASADKIVLNGEECIFTVSIDLTEWKREEEALKLEREYLNRVINCIGDPIFVKDEEFKYILVNDAMCAWTGKRREEFLGRTAHEIFPEDRENIDALLESEALVFKTGREYTTEDELKGPDAKKRTVLTKKSLLRDSKGNRQIVGVVRDITEMRKLEAQLRQAQKMEALGTLAGGVAHDFNNLITVILGTGELVLSHLDQGSLLREEVEEIIKAAKTASMLTSQLLAFSRKQIISPKCLDLNKVVEDMSSMLRRLIGEDVELIVRAQPGLGLVKADPAQVQHVIMNLAANARDAMPNGGMFTIETANVYLDEDYVREHMGARTGQYVMLAVKDSGKGMDKETQARIFEPFFTTKGPGKGTGLGLATVYGIVKQSDGYVWVDSEPGKGTTFKVYFPRVEGEASNLVAGDICKDRFIGDKTVLVVEDEDLVRSLICRILRMTGCNVLEASDCAEALRIAQDYKGEIHMMLTDVVMPKMSGRELASIIEAVRPGIKVLYVSGYTNDAIVNRGVLDSTVNFLQKPFTVESLTDKVVEVIYSSTRPGISAQPQAR